MCQQREHLVMAWKVEDTSCLLRKNSTILFGSLSDQISEICIDSSGEIVANQTFGCQPLNLVGNLVSFFDRGVAFYNCPPEEREESEDLIERLALELVHLTTQARVSKLGTVI